MLDLLAWAERFIATPSVSWMGNGDIARLAGSLVEQSGIRVRIETAQIDGVTYHTPVVELGPLDRDDGLLLVTHLDTVPPGEEAAWTATGGDPFRPTRVGDRLYGLGSADAKVDFICKVAALEALDLSRLRRPVRLVGSFAEEIGMMGARWLIDSGLTRGMRYALVGEPSELVAIHAHKGYAKFSARVATEAVTARAHAPQRLEFRGRSAHSSTPHLGENAIEAALERLTRADVRGLLDIRGGNAVNKVPDACSTDLLVVASRTSVTHPVQPLATEPLRRFHEAWQLLIRELRELRDGAFDPAHTVANLGEVEREGNTVRFAFDLRPVPGGSAGELVRPLEKLAELRCLRTNPPLWTSADSELLRTIVSAQRDVGLAERVATKATCTEAGLLAEAGLEPVVLGAGVSVGNVHRPNEHTLIPQLPQARALYKRVIERLCMEPAD